MNTNIVVIDGKYVKMDSMCNITTIGDKKIIDKMIAPVKCSHCGKIYDLTEGKVVHRFADCTLYDTPCCNTKADDRVGKSIPDFTRLEELLIES